MNSPWDEDERDWSRHDDRDEESPDIDADDEPTYPCPSCRQLIYEEADACPYCGEYLAYKEVRRASGKPWWLWLGLLLAMIPIALSVVCVIILLIATFYRA